MTLTLTCTVCGSPTQADAASLRRGFTTCRSCGSVHRVTEDGLAAAPCSEELVAIPEGLQVKEHAGSLSLTARLSKGASYAYGRELLAGLITAITVGVVTSRFDVPWFVVPIAAFPAFFLGLMATGKLRRFPPPVVLSKGLLRSGVRLTKIPTQDVDQIYTTEFNPNMAAFGPQIAEVQRQQSIDPTFWVCAIRKNGSRVQLLGPLNRLDHALYVEERLEAALGIANRGVKGELHDGTTGSNALSSEGSAVISCEGCGADHNVGDDALRRGFVLCHYCRTATVVQSGGPLGEGFGEAKEPLHDVVDGDDLTIVPRTGGGPVVVLSNGSLRTASATYDLGNVSEVLVKPAGEPSVRDLLGMVGRAGQMTAYTARRPEDAAAIITDMMDLKLRIVATVKGTEVVLIDGLDDPRETFDLVARLRKRLV